MIEEHFSDEERRYLLNLAMNAVPPRHPDKMLIRIISRLSGVDTRLVAHRAYPSTMRTLIETVHMLCEAPMAREARRLQRATVDIWHMMLRKFGKPIGVGRHRAVWGNDRYVFKIPLNEFGIRDNIREAELYNDRANQPFPMGRCRLMRLKGVPILVMEHIASMDFKDKPDWSSAIDSQQVGRNRAGKVVAYDYA